MFGGGKQHYWYVKPEESRQFVNWLKSLFGIRADTEHKNEGESEKYRQDSECKSER